MTDCRFQVYDKHYYQGRLLKQHEEKERKLKSYNV